MKEINQKPEITYPCRWPYRVIGSDTSQINKAVSNVMGDKKYTITLSNTSSGGKYVSFNVKTRVKSEDERIGIFNDLKSHDAIKMVL